MSNNRTPGIKSFGRKAVLLIYPFLLAYCPIFALRNHNVAYVDLATILRTLILVTAGTALLGSITYLFVRDLEKSSVILSIIVILFLSYGHIYNLIGDVSGGPTRHRYLVGAELLIFLILTVLVLNKDQAARVISQFLAAFSVILLAIVLFESARYDIGEYRAMRAVLQNEATSRHNGPDAQLPDFYLIILDAHTRSDVLKSRYGYDNSSFIEQLRQMGFYVGSCSQSNYASTLLSLESATYADYIPNIVDVGAVLPPLNGSAVNRLLRSLGYKTIAFENRARGHFDLREDIRLSRNQMVFGKYDLRGGISEFEKMMVDTSFLRFVLNTELIPGFTDTTLEEWGRWEHYDQTQYILSELENVPEIPGPKFVFAHIMVPHSPYIFAPDGSYLRTVRSTAGYRSNVEFIDSHLPAVLHAILQKSNPSPVIVVMGDHGPSTRRTITKQMRMANLSAYLVNDAARAQLYPTITPVNAFRIILNAHYGTNYPLLEDLSYYAYKPSQLNDAEIIANNCETSP